MKQTLVSLTFVLWTTTLLLAQGKEVAPEVVAALQKNIEQTHQKEGNHALPEGSKIEKITLENGKATLFWDLPKDFLKYLTDEEFEELNEQIVPFLNDLKANEYYFLARNSKGEFVPLERFLPSAEIPMSYGFSDKNLGDVDKDPSPNSGRFNVMPPAPRLRKGALVGKTIWLSAGHGWQWKNNEWITQRMNTYGVVEDFGTIEAVNYYLIKYLENAGATVWTVRERDMNPNEVIVDDESEGFRTVGNWTKSTAPGYRRSYQYIYTRPEETGRAIYTPEIPESGWYWVSVFFRNGSNRSKDVRYAVQHAGGETVVSINQEVHGLTWVYLGQFYFEKGKKGGVVVSNLSSDVGEAVIADAVRFGGGMGSIPETGGLSGKPRYDEAAKYYAAYQGFASRETDVTIRPEYAEWELAKGTPSEQKNAIYLSWHTNAGGGKATGTESFIHNYNPTDKSFLLCSALHQELIGDIRKEWNPTWVDRGVKKANFGELRRLRTMPGALVEVAFHDNEEDARAILTPKFRNLAARALYQGIVKYFAKQDGSAPVLSPETPTHLSARNTAAGRITLSWNPPTTTSTGGGDAPTGYKVYISTHGKGFAEGVEVGGTSYTFENLKSETTYYFKVSAVNLGGESFATAVVAARTPKTGAKPDFLLVDGFDRLDRFSAINQFESEKLGDVKRVFIDRMNSYDYAAEHAKGLAYANVSFDGALNEAVMDLKIKLTAYKGVYWALGEESSADASLNAEERKLIAAYLSNGGKLIISGSEHAFEMGRGNGTSPWFFQTYLKAKYAGDNAETYQFTGVGNEFLKNIKGNFSNGKTMGSYDVDFPDRLEAMNGSKVILKYDGGTNDGAAVAYAGKDFRVVNFGFPLESVTDENVRNELIGRSVDFLLDRKSVLIKN